MRATSRLVAVGILVVATFAQSGAVGAENYLQGCPRRNPAHVYDRYEGNDPRVRVEMVDGSRMLVVVPPAYETSNRRYPVVWLFHGGLNFEDCFLTETDLLAFTANDPDDRQVIFAIPDGTEAPAWADARDGSLHNETRFLTMFIPTVDARYRTIADGRHRAIAGFSAGGLGAMHLAARYPDRFAAAAALSGLVAWNETQWFALLAGNIVQYVLPFVGGGTPGVEGIWGDPVTQAIWWRDFDPVTLAPNYGGTRVSIFTGNGVPCDLQDVPDEVTTPVSELELEALREASLLSAALTRADVAHVFHRTDCGTHTYRYVERQLHAWLPTLFSAFGAPRPASFDHRRAVSSFSVWGWTFVADPRRAPEFLDVTDASATGVTVTGSGVERVTTAGYFRPGSEIALSGAVEPNAVADPSGRVTFHVDLGPPHEFQQYTPAARAQEALGDYWTSKTVRLSPSS